MSYVFSVDNDHDSGIGTLRQAILDSIAYYNPTNPPIQISMINVDYVNLTSPLPDIIYPTIIEGSITNTVTISSLTRIGSIKLSSIGECEFKYIIFANSTAVNEPVCLDCENVDLILTNCVIQNNICNINTNVGNIGSLITVNNGSISFRQAIGAEPIQFGANNNTVNISVDNNVPLFKVIDGNFYMDRSSGNFGINNNSLTLQMLSNNPTFLISCMSINVNNVQFNNNAVISTTPIDDVQMIEIGADSTIINCTMSNTNPYYGCFVYSNTIGGLNISNCNISNVKSSRGAIGIDQSTNVIIENTTFTNCNSDEYGGAIRNNQSDSLVVNGCTFNGCTAMDEGGAIYFNGSGTISMEGVNVFDNCSTINDNSKGGAISLELDNTTSNIVNLGTLEMSNNNAPNDYQNVMGYGGAIYINGSTINVNVIIGNDSTFINNISGEGGVIYVNSTNKSITVTMNSIININRNYAVNNGSVIYNNNSIVNMINCENLNVSTPKGPTNIYSTGDMNFEKTFIQTCEEITIVQNNGRITFSVCCINGINGTDTMLTLNDSIAEIDMCLFIYSVCNIKSNDSTGINIYNTSFSKSNTVAIDSDNSVFNLYSCTFNENNQTGTINNSTLYSANCIYGDINSFLLSSGSNIISYGNNIIVDNIPFFDQPTDLNSTDPKLNPISYNGGFSDTYSLAEDSPAINYGNKDFAHGMYDQRGEGYNRIVNDIFDVGAYQRQQDVICVLGDSMVRVRGTGKDNKEIKYLRCDQLKKGDMIMVKHINNVNGIDKVDEYYSSESIEHNVISGPTRKLFLFEKSSINPNVPNKNSYFTGGHIVIINGLERKVRDLVEKNTTTKETLDSNSLKIINSKSIGYCRRVIINKPVNVYSIYMKERCIIDVDGIDNIASGLDEFVNNKGKNDYVENN